MRIVVLRTILFVLFSQIIYAQNEADVLRYSTTDIFGSARFEAMSGSFGALGADLSAIQVNPAGMGRFSSSRLSASFNNSFIQTEGIYNQTTTHSDYNKFTLSSGGGVITKDLSQNNDGRKYSQITLGYTRLKNFSNSKKYEGQNFNSLLEVLASQGTGIDTLYIYDERPFTTGLAYDVYALDYNSNTGEYVPRLTMGDMYHHREINTRGGIGEFHIGYSENFENKFYYGASLGIRRVKYKESYHHNEKLLDTVGVSLRSFNYTYEQETRGTGVNLKLGVLYLPSEQFRIGLAFESPTIIKFKDEWTNNMTATHKEGINSVLPEYVPTGEFEYRIKTPMKIRSSFAYILGMRGAVNVDFEIVRLQGGKLKPYNTVDHPGNAYEFTIENKEVKNQFRTILNTRIGAEYMIFNDIYLRGGFAILPQPYKKKIGNENIPNMTYSGGLGWENKEFYIDISYRLLALNEDYFAFDPSKIENRTTFKTHVHNVVLTIGLKL